MDDTRKSGVRYSVVFPGREAFYKEFDINFYNNFELVRDIYGVVSEEFKRDFYKFTFIEKDTKNSSAWSTIYLITYCYSIYSLLKVNGFVASAFAGYSQGEFTAVAAANCLKLTDTLKLVRKLEQYILEDEVILMGKMARVVGLSRDKLIKCCNEVNCKTNERRKSVDISIYLSEDQNIISGSCDAIEHAQYLIKQSGARWVIPLDTGGAYHCNLCSNLEKKSKDVFDEINFLDVDTPIYTCSTGTKSNNGNEIKNRLSRQVSNAMHWNLVIDGFYKQGINMVIEIGPGCTVSGNSRIINNDMEYLWITTLNDYDKFISLIGG